MNVSDACRDVADAEAILGQRIGFPVTLVERTAERGSMVWVVFCDGAEVCEIDQGIDIETVTLPKHLTSGNAAIQKRLELMRAFQWREHAFSHLLTMRPDLANEVHELYCGESDPSDHRVLLSARADIDEWRRRLRDLCFEQLTDLDVQRLLNEILPSEKG